MTFIIGPTVTLKTLTSTDKLYKIHVILQEGWLGLQAAASLHNVIKISACKHGKNPPLANLFNGSDTELFPKENSLWSFSFFLQFLSLEMMD